MNQKRLGFDKNNKSGSTSISVASFNQWRNDLKPFLTCTMMDSMVTDPVLYDPHSSTGTAVSDIGAVIPMSQTPENLPMGVEGMRVIQLYADLVAVTNETKRAIYGSTPPKPLPCKPVADLQWMSSNDFIMVFC